MTVAEQIADQIRSDNPHLSVRDYAGPFSENLGAGRVQVQVYRVSLTPNAQANVLTHGVRIEFAVGAKDPAAAEAALADALDDVLLSLQRIEGVSWSQAERAVFAENLHGWTVTASADSINVYRQQVLAESD